MKNKIIPIMLLIVIILFSVANICQAITTEIDPSAFKPPELDGNDLNAAVERTKGIITAIRTIALIIVVISVMVLGIKYMAGTVEQKADYKRTILPVVLGIIFVFIVTYVVTVIYEITQDINKL